MKKLAWLAVLAAAVVLPALASGQGSVFVFGAVGGARVVSVTTLPASASGELIVSFHGDPATGCAQRGLCQYSGTIVLRPGDITLAVIKLRERRRVSYQVFSEPGFGDQATLTVAHVQRTRAAGPPGLCGDAAQPTSLPTATSNGGTLTLTLVERHTSILSTRCAGPLDGDVAAATPRVAVAVKTLLRGHLALGLGGTHAFAANGFAGTVSSTVVFHLGVPHRQAGVGSTSENSRHTRTVTESFVVARQSGHFVALVRGSGNPALCQPLDSCRLSGKITIDPGFVGAQAVLTASGSAARPDDDFLAALGLSRRGNPRGVQVYGTITSVHAGSVTADLTQSGSCVDSAPVGNAAIVLLAQGGAFVSSYFAPSLRTRCPGPSSSLAPLALARAERAVLDRRELTLTFRAQRSFTDDGYVGSLRGSVTLVLRRGRVIQSASEASSG